MKVKKRKNTRTYNGDGSFRKVSKRCYEWSCMIGRDEETGKRKYKYIYAPTMEECKQKRDQYLRDMKDGIVDQDCTFKEFAESWYNAYLDEQAPATWESHRYTVNMLLRTELADIQIKEITIDHIEHVLKEIRKTYSASAFSKCRWALKAIMDRATALGYVRENLVTLVKPMKRKVSEPKKAFSQEEINLLMTRLPLNKIGLSVRAGIICGLRGQEVLGLDVGKGHIAQDGSWIKVEQAMKRKKGTAILSTTKNDSSKRTIPVPKKYRQYIVMLRECANGGLLWESPAFPGSGKPINPSTFSKYYKEAISAIDGVRPLAFHSCRHTFTTQLQAAGVSMETIGALTGHAELDSIETYLHIRNEVLLAAVEKLADSLD